MPHKEVVHSKASHAFMRMQFDKAEEFSTLMAFAAKLDELHRVQEDKSTSLWKLKPMVTPIDKDDPMQGWELKVVVNDRQMEFREHAFSQYASFLGFPGDVLAKCPSKLAADNLKHFTFLKGDEPVFVRTEAGDVRAFLGGAYKAVDHREVIDAFLRSKLTYDVNYAGLTAKRMFMVAIEPSSKFEGPDGSVMHHGTYVGNSETGEGGFWGCDFFYDYICQNRNIWGFRVRGGEFKKIHRGDVRDSLTRLMEWIGTDRRAEIKKAQEIFARMSEDGMGADSEKLIDWLHNDRGIQKKIAEQALAIARDRWPSGDYTRFRIYSGLTKAAQAFGPDKRYEVETAAAGLLVGV